MKSLKESLFDDDLISKELSISELYEFVGWSVPTSNDIHKIDDIVNNLREVSPSLFNKLFKYGTGKYSKYLNYDIHDEDFGDVGKDINLDLILHGKINRECFLWYANFDNFPFLWLTTWILFSLIDNEKECKQIFYDFVKQSISNKSNNLKKVELYDINNTFGLYTYAIKFEDYNKNTAVALIKFEKK